MTYPDQGGLDVAVCRGLAHARRARVAKQSAKDAMSDAQIVMGRAAAVSLVNWLDLTVNTR